MYKTLTTNQKWISGLFIYLTKTIQGALKFITSLEVNLPWREFKERKFVCL